MRKTFFLILSFLFLTVFPNCANESFDTGINLELSFSEPFYDNYFLDMEYSWFFNNANIEYNENFMVYVHFWSMEKKAMIYQDDHPFPADKDHWISEEIFQYDKRVMIPYFIDDLDENLHNTEKIRLNIGIYDPFDRKKSFPVFSEELVFEPLPYNYPRVTFGDGWYIDDEDKDHYFIPFRWTSKRASLIVDNINAEMDFHIKGSINRELFPDQTISIHLNDRLLSEFYPMEDEFINIIPIPLELMENPFSFNLFISTNQTFIPSELGMDTNDNRELGIKIYYFYFEEIQ